jgi:hypothetical protein
VVGSRLSCDESSADRLNEGADAQPGFWRFREPVFGKTAICSISIHL